MLRFQWDALRVGDRVLVHDDLDAAFESHGATVRFVTTNVGRANEIALRLDDPPMEIVRPRRHAVHQLPVDTNIDCWRCAVATRLTADPVTMA